MIALNLDGPREQLRRSRLFLAQRPPSPPHDRFAYLVASAYFARAAVEVLLEGMEAASSKKERRKVEQQLETDIRHARLVRRIRIHDFHRFALRPPEPGRLVVSSTGPGELSCGPNNGDCAFLTWDPEARPVVGGTPGTSFRSAGRYDRPDDPMLTLRHDGDTTQVLGEDGKTWVDFASLLGEYQDSLDRVLNTLQPEPSSGSSARKPPSRYSGKAGATGASGHRSP